MKSLGAELGTACAKIQDLFAFDMRNNKLPIPEREFEFQKWRFCFAWPSMLLAVEVGDRVDSEKLAVALVNGWAVLPVRTKDIHTGQALNWVRALVWERRGLV